MRWEYRRVPVVCTGASSDKELTKLGEEGWEAYAVTEHRAVDGTINDKSLTCG